MWQLSFPVSEEEAVLLQKEGPEALLRRARTLCSGWHPPIPQLLESTLPTCVTGYPCYDRDTLAPEVLRRVPVDNEVCGFSRVTLMGDALHPMSPFKGQGANQALVDAVSLASFLDLGVKVAGGVRELQRRRAQEKAEADLLPPSHVVKNAVIETTPSQPPLMLHCSVCKARAHPRAAAKFERSLELFLKGPGDDGVDGGGVNVNNGAEQVGTAEKCNNLFGYEARRDSVVSSAGGCSLIENSHASVRASRVGEKEALLISADTTANTESFLLPVMMAGPGERKQQENFTGWPSYTCTQCSRDAAIREKRVNTKIRMPRKARGDPYTGWRVVEGREEAILRAAERAAQRGANPSTRSPRVRWKGGSTPQTAGGDAAMEENVFIDPLSYALAGFEKVALARAAEKVTQSRDAALYLHTLEATSPANCTRTAAKRVVGEKERLCAVLSSQEYLKAKELAQKLFAAGEK